MLVGSKGAMNTTHGSIDSLMKGLRTMLASLPSEEEKAQLIQTLRETKDFLEELRLLLEAFPTTDSSQGLQQSISRLDVLADRAARNAPLRRLMGLKAPQKPRSGNGAKGEGISSRAAQLEKALAASESSDVAALLERSGEPLAVLMAVGTSLGLRIRSKERKVELVQRIATHIISGRGYDALGNDGLERSEAKPKRRGQQKAGVR